MSTARQDIEVQQDTAHGMEISAVSCLSWLLFNVRTPALIAVNACALSYTTVQRSPVLTDDCKLDSTDKCGPYLHQKRFPPGTPGSFLTKLSP